MIKTTLASFVLLVTSLSNIAVASNTPSVDMLKAQIVTLARSYQGQVDVDGSKKRALESLIQQLLAQTPSRTTAEKATNAVGAWHELWGPYSQNDSTKKSKSLDPSRIYQVISTRGYYTNVAVNTVLGHQVVGLLRGSYKVESNQISIQFVENGIVRSAVPQGYSLADIPALYDAGKMIVTDFPKSLPPVGIRGSLHEIYSDDTLRLTYGVQEPLKVQTLYVLERVSALNN